MPVALLFVLTMGKPFDRLHDHIQNMNESGEGGDGKDLT
jgi:hypothetical protein